MGYSPWGRKELDTTERLHFHFSLKYHNYLFRGLIFKYGYNLRYWELELQHMDFGGDTVLPITKDRSQLLFHDGRWTS